MSFSLIQAANCEAGRQRAEGVYPKWATKLGLIFYFVIAVGGAFALGFKALEFLNRPTFVPNWSFYGLVGVSALIVGATAYWLREVRRLRVYALTEIAVGVVMAALTLNPMPGGPLAKVLAVIGGVRIVVDGMKRFRDFS